jgi:hypothetical protein
MNLKEALAVLQNNNYLVEFLQDTRMLDYDTVIKRINDEANVDFEFDVKHQYPIYVSKTLKSISKQTLKKIREIANIYSMSVNIVTNYRRSPNAAIMLSSISTKDPNRIYRPTDNNSRLFVHWSIASPEIIRRTGLRMKNIKDKTDKTYERRIYLSSLEMNRKIQDGMSVEELTDVLLQDIENEYDEVQYAINDADVGEDYPWRYMYLVKLPDNFPVRADPEGFGDTNWVYTVHNIPPKYVLFLTSVNDDFPNVSREELVEFITK